MTPMSMETRSMPIASIETRMSNPLLVFPGALEAIQAMHEATSAADLPDATRYMVRLRASQINGCSFCVELHSRELRAAGEGDERIFTVAVWREAPYFSEAERAALALTEAVTRLSDRADPVPTELWDEVSRHYDSQATAALLIEIGVINVWNRVNVAVRRRQVSRSPAAA
jgi:AhpD family alkylhydroperoxidase